MSGHLASNIFVRKKADPEGTQKGNGRRSRFVIFQAQSVAAEETWGTLNLLKTKLRRQIDVAQQEIVYSGNETC